MPTIFDKILDKEIPSEKVYEDDVAYAFKDIGPVRGCGSICRNSQKCLDFSLKFLKRLESMLIWLP